MSETITVDREVIACLVDWINTGLDLGHWRQYDEVDPEQLELAQQVDQILTTRSWEGTNE